MSSSDRPSPKELEPQLEQVLTSFCTFDAGATTSPSLLDNAKLNKLLRDLKIYGKHLRPVDSDISVLGRTERYVCKLRYS